MSNLPPGVSINDSDAPWNQTHPEPDFMCTECDWYGTTDVVTPDQDTCPVCSEPIKEY